MALRRAGHSLLPRVVFSNWQGFAPVAASASPSLWHDDAREPASVSAGLPTVCTGANLTRQPLEAVFAMRDIASVSRPRSRRHHPPGVLMV